MVSARIVSLDSSCLATIPFSLAFRSSRIWLCLRKDAALAWAILKRSVLYSSCEASLMALDLDSLSDSLSAFSSSFSIRSFSHFSVR